MSQDRAKRSAVSAYRSFGLIWVPLSCTKVSFNVDPKRKRPRSVREHILHRKREDLAYCISKKAAVKWVDERERGHITEESTVGPTHNLAPVPTSREKRVFFCHRQLEMAARSAAPRSAKKWLTSLFKDATQHAPPPSSSSKSVAKERLQIILAHQRGSQVLAGVDLAALQQELLACVQRHIRVATGANINIAGLDTCIHDLCIHTYRHGLESRSWYLED